MNVRRTSKVLLTLIASIAATAAVVAGLVWAAVFEPWPISRRHGPDTPYAKETYARLLGHKPPAGAREIYGREEWGFGGDSVYSLRFRFEAPETIAAIVGAPEWRPVRPENLGRLRYLRGPPWWPPEAALRRIPEAYDNRGIEALWVDRANGIAYFQRANF